jgi:hypothetical protein
MTDNINPHELLNRRVRVISAEDGAPHVVIVVAVTLDDEGEILVRPNRADAPWTRVLAIENEDARLGRVH